MEQLWMRVAVVGPLLGHVACYAATLEARGYSVRTIDDSVRLVAQLSRWLASQGLEASDLRPVVLEWFLRTRRESGYRTRSQLAYASLLKHLRQVGVLPELHSAGRYNSATDSLLDAYQCYLVQERGLAPTTVRAYLASATGFLAGRLEPGGTSVERLTPRDVTDAILAECRRRKPGAAKRWLTELRSLLRFLEIEGRTRTGLLGAVPAVPGWKGVSLPRYLTEDQVARLLAGCDQGCPVGRRDFAIVMLLARLGLRSLEVANLKLDDVDWRRGEIVVHAKGHCECLPLPSDVGRALSAYLHDRPRASCRSVFLTVLAPIEGLAASGIGCVVRRACRRAGLHPFGAHRLRHTVATQMLNAGASLAEVGQVLRHQDPQTTAIYAKVDQASLRSLAQCWPGGIP